MKAICKDNFSFPSLTEWKEYEAKIENGILFILDDLEIWRNYPEDRFDIEYTIEEDNTIEEELESI